MHILSFGQRANILVQLIPLRRGEIIPYSVPIYMNTQTIQRGHPNMGTDQQTAMVSKMHHMNEQLEYSLPITPLTGMSMDVV